MTRGKAARYAMANQDGRACYAPAFRRGLPSDVPAWLSARGKFSARLCRGGTFLVAVSQERPNVRRCSRKALAKQTHVPTYPPSSVYVRTYTHARAYVRTRVRIRQCVRARARASVRPCARLAVTDGDRGACSVCQSVQRVLGHFVDHALGRPTAVGGDRCGARDAGGGQRCWRARSAEVILTCAVACDW